MSEPLAHISSPAAAAEANAFARLLDGGYLEIRTGRRPSDVDAPASGEVLAVLRFDHPSAPRSTDGLLVFNPLLSERSAPAAGEAGYFRAYASDRKTAIWDGSVGTEGATLRLGSTIIQLGSRVEVQAVSYMIDRG